MCLCGSEMVLLGVVIGKCEMSSTHIPQENEYAILPVKCQFMFQTIAWNFENVEIVIEFIETL